MSDWLAHATTAFNEHPVQALRDIGSLAIGLLSVVLAIFAVRMGRHQGRIAEIQATIAKQQHELLHDQLSRRTDLRVESRAQNTGFDSEGGHKRTTIKLRVANRGSKMADGFHWEVFIPRELTFTVIFVDDEGEEIPGLWSPMSETEVYDKQEGHYTHRLYQGSDVHVATLAVDYQRGLHKPEFTIKWRIRGEDGIVPNGGLGEISYRRHDDGMYAVRHQQPISGSSVKDVSACDN